MTQRNNLIFGSSSYNKEKVATDIHRIFLDSHHGK
jgi:hypothetical protein